MITLPDVAGIAVTCIAAVAVIGAATRQYRPRQYSGRHALSAQPDFTDLEDIADPDGDKFIAALNAKPLRAVPSMLVTPVTSLPELVPLPPVPHAVRVWGMTARELAERIYANTYGQAVTR
jgi:hypothetical protein